MIWSIDPISFWFDSLIWCINNMSVWTQGDRGSQLFIWLDLDRSGYEQNFSGQARVWVAFNFFRVWVWSEVTRPVSDVSQAGRVWVRGETWRGCPKTRRYPKKLRKWCFWCEKYTFFGTDLAPGLKLPFFTWSESRLGLNFRFSRVWVGFRVFFYERVKRVLVGSKFSPGLGLKNWPGDPAGRIRGWKVAPMFNTGTMLDPAGQVLVCGQTRRGDQRPNAIPKKWKNCVVDAKIHFFSEPVHVWVSFFAFYRVRVWSWVWN